MKDLIVKEKIDLVEAANNLRMNFNTKQTYIHAMNSFSNYCKENNLKQDLDSLRSWVQNAKKPSTQTVYIAAAKKVLLSLFKGNIEIIEVLNSFSEFKPAKRDVAVTESKYLTKDEINKLLDVCSPRIGAIVKTLFITGLRISELLNLEHNKCNPIREGKVYEIKIIGKRSKENTVYISSGLYEEINENFKGKIYLFENEGHRFRREYITRAIKYYGKKIGKNISAHTIRHSKAHEMMEKGIAIDKVSKFLNHSSINTTSSFYLHRKPTLEEIGVL